MRLFSSVSICSPQGPVQSPCGLRADQDARVMETGVGVMQQFCLHISKLSVMSNPLLIRTAARWKIDRGLAVEVLARDVRCIYCSREFSFSGSRASLPSWEHIVNDLTIVNSRNIALCCVGCNASKGRKALEAWLESTYCKERGITQSSMAPIATQALTAVRGAAIGSGQGVGRDG